MRGLSEFEKETLASALSSLHKRHGESIKQLMEIDSNLDLISIAILADLKGLDIEITSDPLKEFLDDLKSEYSEAIFHLPVISRLMISHILLNKYTAQDYSNWLEENLGRIEILRNAIQSRELIQSEMSSNLSSNQESNQPDDEDSNLPMIIKMVGGAVERVINEIEAYTETHYPLTKADQVAIGRFVQRNSHLNTIQNIDFIVNSLTFHGTSGQHRQEFLTLCIKYGPADVHSAIEFLYSIGLRDEHATDSDELGNSMILVEFVVHLIAKLRQDEDIEDIESTSWVDAPHIWAQFESSAESYLLEEVLQNLEELKHFLPDQDGVLPEITCRQCGKKQSRSQFTEIYAGSLICGACAKNLE